MNPTHSKAAYSAFSIWMHWLMLLLIAAVCALMELKSIAAKGSELRTNMALLHYLLGLAVFALVWLRMLGRIGAAVPPITPVPPRWQSRLARAIHWLLYALMLVLPLLGWLAISARGNPVDLFGFGLPFPIAPDKALAKQFTDLHETGATIAYFLIGMHAFAALFHHYKVHDDTLRRMLPSRFRT